MSVHTSGMISSEVRELVAQSIKDEIRSMMRWRDIWKKAGDACEATAKVMTGVGAVLAFASSAIRDTSTADILSFSSGTVGTLGLVMLTFATYASNESKQRTSELNAALTNIGITPLPDIATIDEHGP